MGMRFAQWAFMKNRTRLLSAALVAAVGVGCESLEDEDALAEDTAQAAANFRVPDLARGDVFGSWASKKFVGTPGFITATKSQAICHKMEAT